MNLKLLGLALLVHTFAIAQVVQINLLASGFNSPVDIANAGDSRLFVVQQGGEIRILNADGTINPTSFLSLTTSTISTGGERGLLGLAFHPNYNTNGFFYLNYTRANDGATVIARYTVSATNPNVANASSGTVLMTIPQPFSNHNGGTIKFGPDGYLYIGMGDGGSGGDPGNRAQNINENLGKLLRIDVDGDAPYSIPPTNPYLGVAGNDEIWAIGLRNPWKFSFDAAEGTIWIADVGQNQFEEMNVAPASSAGLNYGWRCYEANQVYIACSASGVSYTSPIAQYDHNTGGCSITGGYAYSGTMYPNFAGKYFFADYCMGRIGMVTKTTGAITYSATFPGNYNFTTFGEDSNGELYVAAQSGGRIFKITDSSLSLDGERISNVQIYPNPASSSLTVDIGKAMLPAQVTIFDLSGKKLLSTTINSAVANINISELQSGLYILETVDSINNLASLKLAVK